MISKFGLDLGLMTLLLKHNLDIVKVYLHTKNEDSKSRHSEVIALTLISDFDLCPMTLPNELNLDIVKVYIHTKNEDSRSRHSKVIA